MRTQHPPVPAAQASWIFRWRKLRTPFLLRLLATGLVGGGFTLLLSVMHVQVGPHAQPVTKKASVIYFRDDSQGRSLAVRAEENGPFPSKFAPEEWQGYAAMKAPLAEAMHIPRPVYVPKLREISTHGNDEPLPISATGDGAFPQHASVIATENFGETYQLAPTISPLTNLPAGALPTKLPEFEPPVDSSLTSVSWRFLIRLNAAGSVVDCVSLSGMSADATAPMDRWLRSISFSPETAAQNPWLGLAVEFINKPKDGTKSH